MRKRGSSVPPPAFITQLPIPPPLSPAAPHPQLNQNSHPQLNQNWLRKQQKGKRQALA